MLCYFGGMTCAFAPSYEDDVALTRVGIVVFQEKELVDTIFLKGRYFDDGADRAG